MPPTTAAAAAVNNHPFAQTKLYRSYIPADRGGLHLSNEHIVYLQSLDRIIFAAEVYGLRSTVRAAFCSLAKS